jgi:hypothetical protein
MAEWRALRPYIEKQGNSPCLVPVLPDVAEIVEHQRPVDLLVGGTLVKVKQGGSQRHEGNGS